MNVRALWDAELIGNWAFDEPEAHPIESFWYAEVGRPLKWSSFKDYVILPLYLGRDIGSQDVYMPCTVIAYVKAGQRYLTDYGCGAYIHLGVRYFYDAGSNICNYTDFGRGFVGTAAALWFETNKFESSSASWSETALNGEYNTTFYVHPTVAWFERAPDRTYVEARLGFGIHGIYKFPQTDEVTRFSTALFDAWVNPSEWSDVTMKADVSNPSLSKQATGFGTEVTGLNTEEPEQFRGLATSTIIYLGSKIKDYTPVKVFFDVVGGLRLLGQWIGFIAGGSGIDNYASGITMSYGLTPVYSEPIDGYIYAETSSSVIVDLKIPTPTRSGWMIIPLTYCIRLTIEPGTTIVGPITKTIQIALHLGNQAGQRDAGVLGDAGNDYGTARPIAFPRRCYGYLDGTADSVDCYSFSLDYETRIMVEVTPPPYVDFDLEVKNPNGDTWASHAGPGKKEYLEMHAGEGVWEVKVSKIYGSGVYLLYTDEAIGGGCPTLFAWNGTDLAREGILDIHAYADITLRHIMQQSLEPRGCFYFLKLEELDSFTSHIDQVKLYAIDSTGEQHVCPLIIAIKNQRNIVTCSLLFDDEARIDLKSTDNVTLLFLEITPYRLTEGLVFEINGYNMKVP